MSIHQTPERDAPASTKQDPNLYNPKKVTVKSLKQFKNRQQPFAMLTAYDYSTAKLLDDAGIETLLVGDSLAMTVLGHPNTLSVTVDEMLHHVKAVRRGTKRAFLVADMPFMTYHISREESLRNAGRFIQEGGADAVKLEGATTETLELIERLSEIGIPVVGHLGLTPQSLLSLGSYGMQAKTAHTAYKLIQEAQTLENAGCVALVLEMVPNEVAKLITKRLDIPTVGIGAGPACDAQVLVIDDILGRYGVVNPSFVRRYAPVGELTKTAASQFRHDVIEHHFPHPEAESTPMDSGEFFALQQMLDLHHGRLS
jgi:3-methyl-2-oxobutanoate hydroxymethyltransferase